MSGGSGDLKVLNGIYGLSGLNAGRAQYKQETRGMNLIKNSVLDTKNIVIKHNEQSGSWRVKYSNSSDHWFISNSGDGIGPPLEG